MKKLTSSTFAAVQIVAAAAVLSALLSGCIGTIVPTPYGRGYRLSVCQLTEASLAWRGTNQVFELTAYKSSVDADAIKAAVESAVKAGIAGAVKAP